MGGGEQASVSHYGPKSFMILLKDEALPAQQESPRAVVFHLRHPLRRPHPHLLLRKHAHPLLSFQVILSVCPSVCLPVCPNEYLSVCLLPGRMSACLSV